LLKISELVNAWILFRLLLLLFLFFFVWWLFGFIGRTYSNQSHLAAGVLTKDGRCSLQQNWKKKMIKMIRHRVRRVASEGDETTFTTSSGGKVNYMVNTTIFGAKGAN